MRTLVFLMVGLAALCLVAGAQSPSGVVINEFQYDDAGTDDREFIELYNGGSAPVDISGWLIMCTDEQYPNDNNPDYMVDLGTILQPGEFWVMGAPTVPNVSQIIGVAPLFQNLFENDNEVIVLMDSQGAIHDMVGYEMAKANPLFFPTQFVEGKGIWGNHQSNDGRITSWSRWFDGLDTDNNGRDFGNLPATPGATNVQLYMFTYYDDFDLGSMGSPAPGFIGSFVEPQFIDPTIADGFNPNTIPPSPQGGLAMAMWDTAGGGNTAFFKSMAVTDFLVECYVYIRTGLTCPDFETWSIGVRGTTDSFHNHPLANPANPPCGNGTLTDVNGQTGIAWHYASDIFNNGVLYLLDEKDGNNNHTVLAAIPIIAGVNDGWQRLRLVVSDDVVLANFGGAYGTDDTGVRIQALTNTVQYGSVYLGYREFIVANSQARPLTIDALMIDAAPQQPYGVFLRQPGGPGTSLFIENRGLTVAQPTYNLFSAFPCATPGSGPYLGLCAIDPMMELLPQLLSPPGTAFFVIPQGSSNSFGPINGIPPGFVIDAMSFELSFGLFGNISKVHRYITQ